jgi:hypothetical protein
MVEYAEILYKRWEKEKADAQKDAGLRTTSGP